MMPSNHHYVCFACRVAIRKPKMHSEAVYCPKCRLAMTALSYKLAIPKQHKIRAWKQLQQRVQQYPIDQEQNDIQLGTSWLQNEIMELKSKLRHTALSNKERARLLRKLMQTEQRVDEIKKRIFIHKMTN